MLTPNPNVIKVKNLFPEAFPVQSSIDGHWEVLIENGKEYNVLGEGPTAKDAWQDAVNNLAK